MQDADDQDHEEGSAGGLSAELIAGYTAFARRVLRERWGAAVTVFGVGLVLTVVALRYLPKTFTCITILMAQGSTVLDGRDAAAPLASAADLILRHENLESIIRDGNLIEKTEQRRPPLLKAKDRAYRAVFGEMTPKDKISAMIGALENRLIVTIEKGNLQIKAEWNDPQTAAELAEAARESFLRSRYSTEMSAFEEKMAILDGHATRLREEITGLAQQLKALRQENAAEARERARQDKLGDVRAQPTPGAALAPRRPITDDAQLPELVERLATAKRRLAELEADRDRRMREEQTKLDELKLKLTPSHPQVITQEERLAAVSQLSSELVLLRAEIKDLQAEIDQRRALARGGPPVAGGIGAAPSATTAEPLPSEIMLLLDRDDIDPALTAQLSSAVLKFSRMREEIATVRVELDLAQAAFNHRYPVVVPAEPPQKPTKPKPPMVIGVGLALSQVLGLLVPFLLELRRGLIAEPWQVHHLQLPILAELKLPPHKAD